MAKKATTQSAQAPGGIVLPLALAQFIASFAATNMNVAISSIATDLHTNVIGVQTAITLFTLVMAALMIPGSKLTDIWGRKRCLMLGLGIYGVGALIGALAPNLPILIIGYSFFEGVGSALLIPPVYILLTVLFTDLTVRARNFGILSAAAGVGAAAGPLIGGLITSLVSWRLAFFVQVLVVALVMWLSRKIPDPGVAEPKPRFDITGALLSAAGLTLVVVGILQSRSDGWFSWSVWGLILVGAAVLAWFFAHIRSMEQMKKQPLLSTKLFENKTSNAGLITQLVQWLTIQGSFFVISVYLQTVHGFNAITTGLALTPTTIGILLSSAAAGRLAKRRPQAQLIRWGFLVTMGGMALLLILANNEAGAWSFVPGLLLVGLGIGVMLTSSVNVVQSSFGENDQGEISGLSRSVSNLGSSLGTAIAGSVLVSSLAIDLGEFALAIIVLLIIDIIGLLAALRIPNKLQTPV